MMKEDLLKKFKDPVVIGRRVRWVASRTLLKELREEIDKKFKYTKYR